MEQNMENGQDRGKLAPRSIKLYDQTWEEWRDLLKSKGGTITADELISQLIDSAGPETQTDMVFAGITRRVTPHIDALVNELRSAYLATQDAVASVEDKYSRLLENKNRQIEIMTSKIDEAEEKTQTALAEKAQAESHLNEIEKKGRELEAKVKSALEETEDKLQKAQEEAKDLIATAVRDKEEKIQAAEAARMAALEQIEESKRQISELRTTVKELREQKEHLEEKALSQDKLQECLDNAIAEKITIQNQLELVKVELMNAEKRADWEEEQRRVFQTLYTNLLKNGKDGEQ